MNRFLLYSIPLILTILIGWNRKKPKILIIGDSISIGYTPFIENYFLNVAKIYHNPGNAQHTGTGLENIEKWIGDEKWDIIQFNWGLWDLCYRHQNSTVQGNRDKINGQLTTSIEDYVENLDSIVSTIKMKTDAKLIFTTTTYVPKNEAGRFKRDALIYNDVAKNIMKKHGILVNDIYTSSIAIHKKYGLGNDDVHYTNKGYEELGNLVISFLESELKSLESN